MSHTLAVYGECQSTIHISTIKLICREKQTGDAETQGCRELLTLRSFLQSGPPTSPSICEMPQRPAHTAHVYQCTQLSVALELTLKLSAFKQQIFITSQFLLVKNWE